ncbi:hypothetical protein MH117_26135 [Paenibacillus sp. ACRRX]|nr:hypothetical protein [Paenibacillus sp. ACRRX]MCG7410869.1 hypothetical protein [Paenibacillus sp. ACRRX]
MIKGLGKLVITVVLALSVVSPIVPAAPVTPPSTDIMTMTGGGGTINPW